jgi:hypothetical protein
MSMCLTVNGFPHFAAALLAIDLSARHLARDGWPWKCRCADCSSDGWLDALLVDSQNYAVL